jgi:hypothetical protein
MAVFVVAYGFLFFSAVKISLQLIFLSRFVSLLWVSP